MGAIAPQINGALQCSNDLIKYRQCVQEEKGEGEEGGEKGVGLGGDGGQTKKED